MVKFVSKIKNDPTNWIKSFFPILKWLPAYQSAFAPYDVIAGFTVGLTILPLSLAYAQLAGLRPEFGLYSCFVGAFVYMLMGTSKDAVIGPSAIGCMLLAQFNILNPLNSSGDNTYATILALITGLLMILIGVLKLGFVVNLFSIPVISGFTSAACLSIIVSQLRPFLGLRKAPSDSPAVFIKQLQNAYDRRAEIRIYDVAFGVSSMLFLVAVDYGYQYFEQYAVPRFATPKTARGKKAKEICLTILKLTAASRNVIVFLVTTGVAYALHAANGKDIENRLSYIGYIKPGMPVPSAPRFQVVNRTQVWVPNKYNSSDGEWVQQEVIIEDANAILQKLSVGIIIIPLMAIMETFAILKAMGRKNGYRIDATQELLAIGLGNFLQSFIGALPVASATAKTVLNERCLVKTQIAKVISMLIVIFSIIFLTEVFYYVPKSALAAILMVAVHRLLDYNAVIAIWKEHKPDLFMFFLTFILCLFYDLAFGIVIAVLINMVVFLRPIVAMQVSISREPIEVLATGHDVAGKATATVIELSHGMKYPSVDKFIDRMSTLLQSPDVHFVMDCRFLTSFDFTGLQAWRSMMQMVFKAKKHMIFVNLSQYARDQLSILGLDDVKYCGTIEDAIDDFRFDAGRLSQLSNVNENVAIVSSDERMVRRLKQTFSVVDSLGAFTRQNSNDGGIELVSSDHVHVTVTRSSEVPLEKPESVSKVLNLFDNSTRPNFYGAGVPMTIGNGDVIDDSLDASKLSENEIAVTAADYTGSNHGITLHRGISHPSQGDFGRSSIRRRMFGRANSFAPSKLGSEAQLTPTKAKSTQTDESLLDDLLNQLLMARNHTKEE